ncbi:MAG: acyl-CoA dehydrogenase family protein [Acidimicrobiia bacterium]|nr:acyl-CoA dehydrogenase family protein [Acidimicrobiia bacterium]
MADADLASQDSAAAEAVRAEVRAWLADHDPPGGRRGKAWLAEVVDAGWAVPSWSTDWYGRGLSPALGRVVDEEFRRVGATGSGQDVVNLWAATMISYGSDDLRGRFLRPLLLGEVAMCLLYSEPGAGSDLASIATRAERDGDEWVVNGQKVWTSSGRQADYALLITRTDWDVPKHRGITFFFFPMRQAGVEVRPLRQATGDSRFNEVFITDARVPDANRLGDVNQGWFVLQTALAYERAAMGQSNRRRGVDEAGSAQAATGAVRGADDDAPAPIPDLHLVELARELGRSDDPVVRQGLARLHTLRLVNDWNNQRGKAALAQGTSSPTVSLGKLAMSNMLHFAGGLQAQILGPEATIAGASSPRAADAAYSLLNAFFTSIGGGTDQIQRNIIGERILGLPKEPEVDKDVAFRDVRRSTPAG